MSRPLGNVEKLLDETAFMSPGGPDAITTAREAVRLLLDVARADVGNIPFVSDRLEDERDPTTLLLDFDRSLENES